MPKVRRQVISDRMQHSAAKYHRDRRDIYDGGVMTDDDVRRRDREIERIQASLELLRARRVTMPAPKATLDDDFMG